jgi:hypothetical protein
MLSQYERAPTHDCRWVSEYLRKLRMKMDSKILPILMATSVTELLSSSVRVNINFRAYQMVVQKEHTTWYSDVVRNANWSMT